MGDRAPMQGDITHVYVQPDSQVDKGDPLLALESMKMEVRDHHSMFVCCRNSSSSEILGG